ncbi:hypothetical protein P3X46_012754 [Hevea brasiliensis]|uniref:RNA helicase n=1 Tax=Hevea brasiliensis TaxID=3981 RepID=A0ABQ9MDW5_HEVBR|nr:ATP-dependent RNA helicase DEAH12, chloroplastic [Hevea brasiliensis]KAJ9177545.1 hypothetical protein P3X46_012754 [Hevea brasiliensis]
MSCRQFPSSYKCSSRPPPHYLKRNHHCCNPRRNNHPPQDSTTTHYVPLNFIIHLQTDPAATVSEKKPDLHSLISECKPSPGRTIFPATGPVIVSLYFREWNHTLAFITNLWDLRLRGVHTLNPKLQSNVVVPSDIEELQQSLKTLFINHVNELVNGELVDKWQQKLSQKCDEIADVSRCLKRRNRLGVYNELSERKKRLVVERNLMGRRVREFKAAMSCILGYLEGGGELGDEEEDGGVQVFTLEGDFDWERIHRLVLREIRRLEDGLPIYSHRQEILRKICGKQVIVLVGETGSGKSTQLVQFLADSGIAANESIICIQPRKIAAISIADRVREESIGCYEDNSIISLPTFSSTRQIDSKVVYMTDHCLLQYCMNDRSLSGISCVIVDEAHERSLNTDLLLAVIKGLLLQRFDLRLVIMSATADANQLSDYFFGCEIVHVVGRNFPVDVRYIPYTIEETASGIVAPYVFEAVRMTMEVHKTEKEGTILAFLTSQMEVEWACEEFETPSAVALPLHGKLSGEEQHRIFENYPGKRKVIFATNLAETSLTIPGVKYVVDSGMVKESKFDPVSGMNVLRVCRINQSSALQRAGRAGRTGPGICYRLYSEHDYDSMSLNQEPEIRRVHLGVAVLRVLALGVRNIQDFDFVDAPSAFAIDMATRNLVQLGAITKKNDVYELTEEGCYLVKLGIEPCRGKLILSCFHHGLGKEGIVLAAVMANSSSIFCRVGNDDNKLKADCLKVQFCHHNGDLFTLLCVYREWESLPRDRRNKWCWENSINAKTMRRCQESVKELEICLEKELHVTIPTDWHWNPHKSSEHDKNLKQAILSALAENVAMYSGCDKLGYQVALTGKHVQLHPSCSLLIFGDKPSWVVFGELLSTFSQYLVCVTAFDFESLCMIFPPPLFDALKMESQKLQVKVMTGFGNTLLKKLCGKSNNNLLSLVSGIQSACEDEQIVVEVNVHQNEILLFATSEHMEKVFSLVKEAVEYEQKRLRNECMEKCLYHGVGVSPSVALFGAGAEIKHLELESRCLTVDIFLFSSNTVHDRELLMFLEKFVSGGICAVHKSTGFGQDGDVKDKWGKVTFLTPDAARKAAQLKEMEFSGSLLKVLPSQTTFESDHKMFSFPAVKAKVYWPRRCSKGFAVVKCDMHDVESMMCDFSIISIRGKNIRCEVSRKSPDSIIISRIDRELFEDDVLDVLRGATRRRILGFFIVRGDAVENPARGACEEALLREISSFMPKSNPHTSCCRVQVLLPEPKDAFMRALITFDGRLHMEAAKALEHMEGKVLPGCLSWQKIKCQQLFHTSLSCSASVYFAIEKELNSLLASFKHLKGVEFSLEKNENSSYRVRISANATRTVAELRRPLEELMKGRIINHASLTPTILTHLFSRQGINLMKSIQRETKTYILFDRWNFKLRIFGSSDNVAFAQQKLIQSLLTYHESRRLEIHLRGGTLPPDMMKKVVKKFGPDLYGLKERVPEAEFTLSTRGHVIYIHGSTESKQKVEEIIFEIAQTSADSAETLDDEATCPICLCEVEDGYRLEDCGHLFCRFCLMEQFESAVKNLDSFPIGCAREGCRALILLSDIRCLLSGEKMEELFRASVGSFVASSGGTYRFCPTPDCPSVYRVAGPETSKPFVCGACFAETCTGCHLEHHPYLSCERYAAFKEDPDLSLKEWCRGRESVKNCPVCGYTIEKVDGCNHVVCKCGRHICWVCLESFNSGPDCYGHLTAVHGAISF